MASSEPHLEILFCKVKLNTSVSQEGNIPRVTLVFLPCWKTIVLFIKK
jgi:hypothetical protein